MTTDKRNSRNPTWVYFVAGTFLTYYVVMVYAELYQPGRTGIEFKFNNGEVEIIAVDRPSPASRAGLRSGDKLLTVDQRAIRTYEDWRHFRATRQIGREYRVGLERARERLEVPLLLRRQAGDSLFELERKRFVQGFLLSLALLFVWRRPGDRLAWMGAWLLAAIGTAPLFPDPEMRAIWSDLPTLVGLLLWIPQISHLMLLPLFFTFFAMFPKPFFQRFWPWTIVWAPALAVAGIWSPHIYAHVYSPPVIEEVPKWLRFVLGAAILIYCGGGLMALFVNYQRLPDMQARRRLRVFVSGALIGLTPLILFLTAIFWGTLTDSQFVWFFVSDAYRHALPGLFLAFPVSLIYASLRHRVFGMTTVMPAKSGQ